MFRGKFKSVRSFSFFAFFVLFSALSIVGAYSLFLITKIQESAFNVKRLIDQPIDSAKSITKRLEDSFSDLYAVSEHNFGISAAELFQKTDEVWERTRYLDNKGDWDDAHMQIPLYRELIVFKISAKNCTLSRVFRNSRSEAKYLAQGNDAPLFPFDRYCEALLAQPEKAYLSKQLVWFTSKENQLSAGVEDPVDSKNPVTHVDGIYRLGRRIKTADGDYAVFLALDARHIFDRVIHLAPHPIQPVVMPSYTTSQYAFSLDSDGEILAHPKFWNLRGYDPKTKKQMPIWNGSFPQTLPIQYPEYKTYPSKFSYLSYVSEITGATIYSYVGSVNKLIKNEIDAPILAKLPGDTEARFLGTVVMGMKSDYFISRIIEFNKNLTEQVTDALYTFLEVLLLAFLLLLLMFSLSWRKLSSPLELLSKMASQVIHDIRSPMMALEMASQRSEAMNEETRQLIRQSLDRIRSIVEDLRTHQLRKDAEPVEPQSLIPLDLVVEEILREKRTEYKARPELDFVFTAMPTGKLFPRMDPRDLRRVLSNLINNSCEAITGAGKITIGLSLEGEFAILSIGDTGPGIPNNILPHVFAKGFSSGKANGTGLGLFHAKETLTAVGGNVEIQSANNHGTSVFLRIPIVPKPATVLIDNDPLVKQVWMQSAVDQGVELKIFSTLQEFQEALPQLDKEIPIFVDYQLDDEVLGTEVVKELQQNGFSNLTLTTGMPVDTSELGIKRVGKSPPWASETALDNSSQISSGEEAELLNQILHDLRPVLLGMAVSMEKLDSLSPEDQDLLKESYGRLRSVVQDLNRKKD